MPEIKKSAEELAVEAAQQAIIASAAALKQGRDAATQSAADAITQAQRTAEATIAELQAAFDSDQVTLKGDLEKVQKALADAQATALSIDSAAKLADLGVTRSKAIQLVRDLNDLKTPTDPDEIARADARLRLAQEAQRRAEEDYAKALASIQSDHLTELLG